MEDFNYVHSNCFEITMELSCCKYPKAEELVKEWDLNKEALIKYMEATHLGIRGQVCFLCQNRVFGTFTTNDTLSCWGHRKLFRGREFLS